MLSLSYPRYVAVYAPEKVQLILLFPYFEEAVRKMAPQDDVLLSVVMVVVVLWPA
jgi:hypothetical protein